MNTVRCYQHVHLLLREWKSVVSSSTRSLSLRYSRGIQRPETTPFEHVVVRYYTSSAPNESLVYTGPLSSAVRSLKIFSLVTACCTLTFSPIIVYHGNQNTPIIGRLAIASLITMVGVSTTLILHWFVKSYVTKLYYHHMTGHVTVETITMFGKRRLTKFHISEAQPPDNVSAFSTFRGGGRSFFLHTELFEDPKLLRQLLGDYATFENNLK